MPEDPLKRAWALFDALVDAESADELRRAWAAVPESDRAAFIPRDGLPENGVALADLYAVRLRELTGQRE